MGDRPKCVPDSIVGETAVVSQFDEKTPNRRNRIVQLCRQRCDHPARLFAKKGCDASARSLLQFHGMLLIKYSIQLNIGSKHAILYQKKWGMASPAEKRANQTMHEQCLVDSACSHFQRYPTHHGPRTGLPHKRMIKYGIRMRGIPCQKRIQLNFVFIAKSIYAGGVYWPVMIPPSGLNGKMKRSYHLIKLKMETVEDLKRLMDQMGKPSLDDLITSMIVLTDAHRLRLGNIGWDVYSKR